MSAPYPEISLRRAREQDAEFALQVVEACMRRYAERTYGAWNGLSNFDVATDQIIVLGSQDIGLIAIERRSDHWFLSRMYVLPEFQNRGIGSALLRDFISDAGAAGLPIRLTVLEVNPARRFYERHGFVLTHIVPPRQHMEL
jgi:GNAT superfamily N-acetyltransferase